MAPQGRRGTGEAVRHAGHPTLPERGRGQTRWPSARKPTRRCWPRTACWPIRTWTPARFEAQGTISHHRAGGGGRQLALLRDARGRQGASTTSRCPAPSRSSGTRKATPPSRSSTWKPSRRALVEEIIGNTKTNIRREGGRGNREAGRGYGRMLHGRRGVRKTRFDILLWAGRIGRVV